MWLDILFSLNSISIMIDFLIKPAGARDIDEIMALESFGFEPGIAERRDVFLGRIKFFLDGFLVMSEKNSDKIIGYISSEIWLRHSEIKEKMFVLNHGIEETHNINGTEIYVSSMTIHPQYRGRGLGLILFSECIRRLRRMNPLINSSVLIVNETWGSAKKIYDSLGYVELFRIKDFFTPDNSCPQDAIVMRMDF